MAADPITAARPTSAGWSYRHRGAFVDDRRRAPNARPAQLAPPAHPAQPAQLAQPAHPAQPAQLAPPAPPAQPADSRAAHVVPVRLAVHVSLAGMPLLAISADVFGLLPMHLTAALVVLPLAVGVCLLVLFDPLPTERIVLKGAGWGIAATLVYDAFRLDTVYLLGWWGDFIPTMGTWVINAPGETGAGAVAGYLWRYLGDGAGIGVVFFVLVAATGLHRLDRGRLVAVSTAFAVVPVWTGLIATVGLSARGQDRMFELTPTTVTLSLIGHLIFGVVLGLGCARCRDFDTAWPWPPLQLPFAWAQPRAVPVADELADRRARRTLEPGRPAGRGVRDEEPETVELSYAQLIAADARLSSVHGRTLHHARTSRPRPADRLLTSGAMTVAGLAVVFAVVVVTPAGGVAAPPAAAEISSEAAEVSGEGTGVAGEVTVVTRGAALPAEDAGESWRGLDDSVVREDLAVRLEGDVGALDGPVRYVLRAPEGETSEAISSDAPYGAALPMGDAAEGTWQLEVRDAAGEVLAGTRFTVVPRG